MKLPHFEKLNLNALDEYYDVEIEFEGQPLQLDLNFEGKSIKDSKLSKVAETLKDLKGFLSRLKGFIQDDFKTGEDVKEFLSYHLEELDQEEVSSLLAHADKSLTKEEQLLSILKLRRIGFYPDNDDEFIVADFETNPELSNYLLVVNINKNGELDYITMES